MASSKWQFGKYTFNTDMRGKLHRVCEELKQEFPDLVMAHKRTVWWEWVRYVFILIFTSGGNRRYLSGFTSTSKNRIDFSDIHHEQLQSEMIGNHDRIYRLLMHERVHLRQFSKYGSILMALAYLHPPFIGLAYGRAMIEKPAYLVSLQCMWEEDPLAVTGHKLLTMGSTYKDWWVSQFTSSAYGWMWPFKKTVEGWYDDELFRLRGGSTR
jgi:hypothetical protein